MKFCRLAVLSALPLSSSVVVAFAPPQKTHRRHHHQCRTPTTRTTRLHAAEGDGGVGEAKGSTTATSSSSAVTTQADMTVLAEDTAAAAASGASSESESVGAAGVLAVSTISGGIPLLVAPLAALLVGRQTLAGRGEIQKEANQKQFELVKARNDLSNTETIASVSANYNLNIQHAKCSF
jgi:hypothetical protein